MRTTIGPIRANPRTRAFLLDLMREVVAVGRAHGVDLPRTMPSSGSRFADGLPARHDRRRCITTSSAATGSRCAGCRGGVVELGAKVGVPTPLNRAVADILALHADGAKLAHDATALHDLTVRGVRASPSRCRCATRSARARATITAAPLLLIDVETEEGVTGRAYLFCYLPQRRAGRSRRCWTEVGARS